MSIDHTGWLIHRDGRRIPATMHRYATDEPPVVRAEHVGPDGPLGLYLSVWQERGWRWEGAQDAQEGHQDATEAQDGLREPDDVSGRSRAAHALTRRHYCLNVLTEHGNVGPCINDAGHPDAMPHDDGHGITWTRSVR